MELRETIDLEVERLGLPGLRTELAALQQELWALTRREEELSAAILAVTPWRDVVADKSPFVELFMLAGLPAAAVRRAEAVLKKLEAKEGGAKRLEELPLFAAFTPAPAEPREPSEADKLLGELDPDSLTPKEALELVYRLKKASSPAAK